MPYEVHDLIGDRPEPVRVLREDSLAAALAKMVAHDYSQLPVVAGDEDKTPVGLVTSDSILRALDNFGVTTRQLRVRDALIPQPPTFPRDADLFEVLQDLQTSSAVLIVDAAGQLADIVTTYDTTAYFRRQAEDIMYLREIEAYLKKYIQAAFTTAAGEPDAAQVAAAAAEVQTSESAQLKRFKKAVQRYLELRGDPPAGLTGAAVEQAFHEQFLGKPQAFEDLTLDHYIKLFVHESRWARWAPIFQLDSAAIRGLLEAVRDTRNALAHFRLDEASPQQHEQIRYCKQWLAGYEAQITAAFAPPTPVDSPVAALPTAEQPSASDRGLEADPDAGGSLEPATLQRVSRYSPLARLLHQQPAGSDRIQLSFPVIETLLGGPLPPSARRLLTWWSNDAVSHVQSLTWLEAGWRVYTANLTDETVIFMRNRELEQAYNAFFAALYTDLQHAGVAGLRPPKAAGSSWYSALITPDKPPYIAYWNAAFAQREFRVELYISSTNAARNKQLFDRLHAQREAIERDLGQPLLWIRAENRAASRVTLPWRGSISATPIEQEDLRQWAVANFQRLYQATADRLRAALAALPPELAANPSPSSAPQPQAPQGSTS